MDPVIIEVALNGVTRKERNRHVPRSPGEIAQDALRCMALGASIVHNHIDDLRITGEVAVQHYAEGWNAILRAHPDALLCPTATIADTSEEQLAHLAPCARYGAAMAPLDPGSINLCETAPTGKPGDLRFAYVNGFDHIEHSLRALRDARLGPSIAIYEPGFLRAVLAYFRAGELPDGAMLKFYFGGPYDLLGSTPHRDQTIPAVSFGLPPTRTSLDAYLELLGDVPLPWGVACLGGDLCRTEVAAHALARGGHLRVGLEDYGGPEEPTNADLVAEAAELCRRAGRRPATPEEAARILRLPR